MKPSPENPGKFGRRKFLQIIAAAGAAGTLWQFGLKPKTDAGCVVRQSRTMMGTQINLIVYGPDRDACEDAVQSTFTRMERLTILLSRHNPESELSSLNRQGWLAHPDDDLREVLLQAGTVSTITDGAFDVTILPLQELYLKKKAENSLPAADEVREALELTDFRNITVHPREIRLEKEGMAVTLDGIAKGYIVDQGVAILKSKGFDNIYVEAGGDLMVSGAKTGAKPWRIGIRNPRPETSAELTIMNLTDRAVATSGDYMQPFTADMNNHHILDPRTGISPPELASATVTAPNVILADGLATAAMVMGPKQSLDVFASLPDCECLLIGKDLERYQTTGFPG